MLEHLLYADTEFMLWLWGWKKLQGLSGPPSYPLDSSDKGILGLSLKVFCDGKLTTSQTSLFLFQIWNCWKGLLWETQICFPVTFYHVPISIPMVTYTKSKPFICWKSSNIWRPLTGLPKISTLIQAFSNPSAIPWLT